MFFASLFAWLALRRFDGALAATMRKAVTVDAYGMVNLVHIPGGGNGTRIAVAAECPSGTSIQDIELVKNEAGVAVSVSLICGVAPTPSPTPSLTLSPTFSPTLSPTPSPTPKPTTPVLPTPLPSTPMPTQQVVVGGTCPRGSTLTTTPAMDGEYRAHWILASNGTVFGSGTDIFDKSPWKTEVYTEYLTGVKAIASGMGHTLFLMENGVVCGRGYAKEPLCDAATSRVVREPIVVMTGVKSFSTHSKFSIFLKETGDLYGCGEDYYGQLGQGSKTFKKTRVLVNTNVKVAWAGASNVLMELFNGSTFVTGSDGWQQFGLHSKWISTVTGSFHGQEVPMELPPPEGLKPFGAALSKFWYTDAQGTLYGQGSNANCEMGLPEIPGVAGNVPTNPRTAPVVHNIKAVASRQTTVFLLKNGTAYTSGRNELGQVGDGSKSQRCGLYWVMDHVQAVGTGYYSSFLLAEDGTVYGSGKNAWSHLGSSSDGGSEYFVKILTID